MEILNLIQGSDEWLTARLNYLCASEAPAMMGDSKFMSRNQLLALKKGWQTNPVGDFKKRLFEKGHESEDAARELLEFDLCEELPPVVGLAVIDDLELLSSFDGFGERIWEHKEWNEILAENVRNGILEPMYYWQLEHQMLTAGMDEVTFMVSDGTEEKRLSMVYKSVPERRADLIAGWKQFLIDLDQYQLEAKQEKIVARQQDAFPSIECRVEGSKVISNLGNYIPVIQSLADEQMSIILETDQDFIDKEAFNKNVKEGRATLKAKASEIETEFESLAEFNGYVKQADSILQKLQSHGEKQVKDAKANKKLAITNGAQAAIQSHLSELSKGINGVQIQGITADWAAIIKGKRSFEKMQEAVDDEIAKLKIKANDIAATIRTNLDSFTELATEHKFLFSDHAELILKNNEDLVNLIKMRIADHEKAEAERLEKERQRIQAEEEAKAKREAEQKAEAERARIREEERQKAQAEQQRISGIKAKINTLNDYKTAGSGSELSVYEKHLDSVKAFTIDSSLMEFEGEAASLKSEAIEYLENYIDDRKKHEELKVVESVTAERQLQQEETATTTSNESPLKSVSPPRKQETQKDVGFDLVARFVPGYGYLPIVIKQGQEIYRGDYQRTAIEAIEKCETNIEKAA